MRQLNPHETRIQSGIAAREEWRESLAVAPVHQALKLPLQKQRALCKAEAQIIADHRDLLAVEIATVNDGLCLREGERVVRRGVQLAGDDSFDMPERFLKRPEDLRRATHGIWVLNLHARLHRLGVGTPRVLVNFAAEPRVRAQMLCHAVGDRGLPAKAARYVNLFAKNFWRCRQRLEQTRGEQFHPTQQCAGLLHRQCRQRRHYRGPVDERKTLLALEGDGL
jgi:hypothetical protein